MIKLWSKYKNWSKLGTEHQVYRYTPKVYRYTLAKNDQNPKCTGTGSKCTGTGLKCTGTGSKCTGTSLRKVPRMCIFSHFSCTFPSQTKSILHKHFKTTSNSSYDLFSPHFIFQLHIFLQTFHEFLPKPF